MLRRVLSERLRFEQDGGSVHADEDGPVVVDLPDGDAEQLHSRREA